MPTVEFEISKNKKNDNTPYSGIKEETEKRKIELNKRILHIQQRQQELQNYITVLDNNISTIQSMLNTETDKEKIKALRSAMTRNVELLTMVHNSYNNYEGVIFRYHKEINDITQSTLRLIDLELRKLDAQIDKKIDDFDQAQLMEGLNNLTKQISQNINNNLTNTMPSLGALSDPDYTLD